MRYKTVFNKQQQQQHLTVHAYTVWRYVWSHTVAISMESKRLSPTDWANTSYTVCFSWTWTSVGKYRLNAIDTLIWMDNYLLLIVWTNEDISIFAEHVCASVLYGIFGRCISIHLNCDILLFNILLNVWEIFWNGFLKNRTLCVSVCLLW